MYVALKSITILQKLKNIKPDNDALHRQTIRQQIQWSLIDTLS